MNKIILKTEARALAIMLLSLALSLWAYPQLPLRVASHWNFWGQVDGWISRDFHTIFFPILLLVMYVTFLIMPYLDPKKERYIEFAGAYHMMRDAIMFVLLGVYATATFYNLNYHINVGAIVAGSIGLLMIILGNYFGKLKRNWFIGLRTPWTLSSENVWNKTHRLGSRLFIIWGILIAVAPWLNFSAAMIILLGGIIAIIASVNIYSYRLFRKEKKQS